MLHKLSKMAEPSFAKARASSGRLSHRMSGWRRTIPDAVQGTSAKIRSNTCPSHQSLWRASPQSSAALKSSRSRLSETRASLDGSLSSATREISSVSSMCTLLPPGAAQASNTRIPGSSCIKGAANCAAASCTETRPCRKPGMSETGVGCVRRTAQGPS